MTRFKGDADLAIGLEPANARTMARARINDDKGAPGGVKNCSFWGNNAHQAIVYRTLQDASIDYQLRLVIEHIRHSLGEMLAILVAALTHDVPKQHRALGRINPVFHRRAEYPERVG